MSSRSASRLAEGGWGQVPEESLFRSACAYVCWAPTGQLEKAALRRVLAADPQTAAKRAATARQRERRVQLSDPADGTAGVNATLRAEEALAATPPALGHSSRPVPANPSLGERHLRNLLTLAG